MKRQVLLILFLQVAPVRSLREVSGYLGDNVTLLSGADPSWTLSSIKWSIFSNNTWIATYLIKRTNIDRVAQYKGRLGLNISTGDLMIYNLTPKDAMEYTVDLINNKEQSSENKATVIVKQRLQKPTILTFASENGGCRRWLQCYSADEGVQLSWQGMPPSGTVYNLTNPDGNSAVLFAFLNATQNQVELTCTSCKNTEKASSVITSKCDGEKPEPQPPLHPQQDPWFRERYGIMFMLGGIVGIIVTAVVTYAFAAVRRKKNNEIN
ncbi:CD48 antigen [Cebidichthys violaceus]|uniref:CD48 antigen n=1 Tax=Cebidichthys violaceus TaxID=271503 RepID=UPI0035CA3682